MNVGFWLAAGALVLLAAVILLWPFLRSAKTTNEVKQRELNITIYRQRLAELDQELASGYLNQEQYDSARAELEDNLLTDVELEPEPEATKPAPKPRQGLALLAVTAVVVPAFAIYIYLDVHDPALRPGHLSSAPPTTMAMPDAADLTAMAQQMETQLGDSPEDAEGWIMLGRTYGFMEQYEDAARAFGRAHSILGDEADLNVSYAEHLMLASMGAFTPQANALLDTALELEPNHPNALWLKAISHFQTNNFPVSMELLERLLPLVQGDLESEQVVRSAMDDVRDALRQSSASPAPVPAPAPQTRIESSETAAIRVQIDLDPALGAELSGEEIMMVFARPVGGPRMPIAVQRVSAQFPLELVLDASHEMIGGASMAQFDQVEVVARVSKSGMAEVQSGDLEGVAEPVNPTESDAHVHIRIDRVLP